MTTEPNPLLGDEDYLALADFRFALRQFHAFRFHFNHRHGSRNLFTSYHYL